MVNYERLTIEGVYSLIQNEEEGTELEYKRSEKLRKDQAVAICKTVSAFANSNGGKLIFGINANDTPNVVDDGIDPLLWKEQNGQEPELWLRQMFSTKIQRNIIPPDIYYLEHPKQPDKKLIIVDVTQSLIGAHQLKEESNRFAYYYRNGSENRQMEDWQIRDVMNRRKGPDLWIDFSLSENGEEKRIPSNKLHFNLLASLTNKSPVPCNTALVSLWFDKKLVPPINHGANIKYQDDNLELSEKRIIETIKIIHAIAPSVPIFGTLTFDIYGNMNPNPHLNMGFNTGQIRASGGGNSFESYIKWEIQAPEMSTRSEIYRLTSTLEQHPLLDDRWKLELERIDDSLSGKGRPYQWLSVQSTKTTIHQ